MLWIFQLATLLLMMNLDLLFTVQPLLPCDPPKTSMCSSIYDGLERVERMERVQRLKECG